MLSTTRREARECRNSPLGPGKSNFARLFLSHCKKVANATKKTLRCTCNVCILVVSVGVVLTEKEFQTRMDTLIVTALSTAAAVAGTVNPIAGGVLLVAVATVAAFSKYLLPELKKRRARRRGNDADK